MNDEQKHIWVNTFYDQYRESLSSQLQRWVLRSCSTFTWDWNPWAGGIEWIMHRLFHSFSSATFLAEATEACVFSFSHNFYCWVGWPWFLFQCNRKKPPRYKSKFSEEFSEDCHVSRVSVLPWRSDICSCFFLLDAPSITAVCLSLNLPGHSPEKLDTAESRFIPSSLSHFVLVGVMTGILYFKPYSLKPRSSKVHKVELFIYT